MMGVGEYHKDLRVFKGRKPTGPQEGRRNLHNTPGFHPCFSLPGCVSIPLSDFFFSAFPKWGMLEVPCVPFHPRAQFLTLLGCVTPVITVPRRETLTQVRVRQTLGPACSGVLSAAADSGGRSRETAVEGRWPDSPLGRRR